LVAQGTIAELTGSGAARRIDFAAAPGAHAAGVLAGSSGVRRAMEHDGVVRVELAPDAPPSPEIVTALLRRLLAEGVAVERVVPVAASLEDRFLDMTTRLEDRS
jgi:ABC-2 type transport system ATP-binding protein